jgi:predicted nucleotidyltransferase
MDTEEILNKLRKLKPLLAERYKVKEISLFGSFVRGEQDSNSDIDILAEFDREADLFHWISLTLFLEEIFQKPVDVISQKALRPEIRETVLLEAIPV